MEAHIINNPADNTDNVEKNVAFKKWVFTINNYTEEEFNALSQIKCVYCVYGKEVGAEGTPHIQGYLELDKNMRRKSVCTLLGGRAWVCKKSPRSTREEARNYCKKENQFTEIGTWEMGGQGTRNDIYRLVEMVKQGKPRLDIIEEMPEVYGKNSNLYKHLNEDVEKEQSREFRTITAEVFWGDAGSGKTRMVMDLTNRTVFTVNTEDAFPFDGYNGEDAILFDDFYGDMKYCTLLRIMDGHQYRVNVKGGHRYAKWSKVYFTSNKPPTEWYKMGLTPALERRITKVTQMIKNDCDPKSDDNKFVTELLRCYEVAGNNVDATLEQIEEDDNILGSEEEWLRNIEKIYNEEEEFNPLGI